MATRKKVKTVKVQPEEIFEAPEVVVKKNIPFAVWIIGAVAALAVLGFILYKTDHFPVVAMVGMKPITRYSINQQLFKQGGQAMVDNMVTEIMVKDELSRLGIKVTDEEVNAKIDSIKKSLGEGQDLTALLAQRGMTLDDVKKQLVLQMGVEKVVSSKVSLTDQEVNKFITDNGQYMTATTEAGKKEEAATALRQQKMQTEVSTWVESLRKNAKVWYANENLKSK